MPEYRQFAGASGVVFVEVENVPGGSANAGDLGDFLSPIGDLAAIISARQASASADPRPEIELRFGIKGLSDGRIAIALNGTGNLLVRMVWKGPESAGIPLGANLPGT